MRELRSTVRSKKAFRLSPKNWPVYYQPSWVQAAQILNDAPFV